MGLTFRCGECGHAYTVPDEMAGRWVRCKRCDSTLEVPRPPVPAQTQTSSNPISQARPQGHPTPERSLVQARPISAPLPSPPIPEAILLPETEAHTQPRPQQPGLPAKPHTPQVAGEPSPRPAPAQPRPSVPQPALQPFSPRPLTPLERPRHSTTRDDSVSTKMILLATGAVGLVLAVVILLIVVVLGGNSGDDLETAAGSPSLAEGTPAGEYEPPRMDFSRQPSAEFGPERTMSSPVPGVDWKEVQVLGGASGPGTGGKLWVYRPVGDHEPGTLGCVLIGPAGSRMINGMPLTEGDQAEHYPYPQQGFAVVAFEIDGALPDENPSDQKFRDAYVKFTAAAAGVANARIALQYATSRMPEVDPGRIFVAGHSSAGTVALLCAEHVDGLAGCVAYAPCSDLEGYLADFVGDIEGVLPNVRQYMKEGSPTNHVDDLGCPVMIFHAIDDDVVRLSESSRFAALASQSGRDVTLRPGTRGGHYDAMINEGIEEAIVWMNRTKSPAAAEMTDNPLPSPPRPRELPRPTPGFQPPPDSASPADRPQPHVRAYVHFKIISYPPSGNPEILARETLRSVVWAEPDLIRVDRVANDLVIGVRVMSLNTNAAKLLLEETGFVIGGMRFEPVRN